MTEEIDDNEFFQQDFTTATEWEVFNARLEEIFHEWKLPFSEVGPNLLKDQLGLCEWDILTETIFFADFEINVTRYKIKLPDVITGINEEPEISDRKRPEQQGCQAFIDIMSGENDFCFLDEKSDLTIPVLARWYGLREFVVLSPGKIPVKNQSQIKLLLSSIHIAVSESSCEVPVFVQVMNTLQNVYLGVCEFQSTRLSFDIVHLSTTPPQCKYMTGLLDMFKAKIGFQYVDPVNVTVRLAYNLNKFINTSFIWKKKHLFSEFEDEDAQEDMSKLLPFGIPVETVKDLILYCSWPQVGENVVMDSQTYSDFDPMNAPVWSIRTRFEEKPVSFMSDCISEYLQLCECKKTLWEFLGDSYVYGSNVNQDDNPLDLLTESKIPTITSFLPILKSKGNNRRLKNEGPLNDEELKKMLYFMFPDAQLNSNNSYEIPDEDVFDPLKIKTAHPDSLVHRLSCLLSICDYDFGGESSMAHLWAEFTQELRYRVERCIQIPGVANGFPDSRTSLLHQKLQMLNICMERRRIREGGLPFSMTQNKSSEDSGDDGEFFDCSDDEKEDNKRHAPWNKPEGRLSRLEKMLLVDSDEPLYIPITQEPVPKTEDQLEDDAEVMLKLGPGSELRAQMMSASLLSDMESFKAANPSGTIEDFIRWYSPRDWIEDEIEEEDGSLMKGHLSTRMLIPDNTWQMVWKTAKPVPARRQKRLFDDAKEAEKVLHYLESRNIGQISEITMASLFHSAIIQLQKEALEENDVIPNYASNIEKIILNCCKLSRENWILNATPSRGNSPKKWELLLTEISNMECAIIQSKSIKAKLFPGKSQLSEEEKLLISSLLNGYETNLTDGSKSSVAVQVLNMFSDVKKSNNEQHIDGDKKLSLPNPMEKQFILRVGGKTFSKGPGGPQFLRAILGQNEFRLCGAFSQDTRFG